ncbi:ArsR/SmtB family transcription factor [Fimbriiglobus ruber]|uniref:Transcriptional regulator, ArsR family n=1 Tax=Fimbriiglobus ruber TaxID=1908690 RepID=A0A225DHZ8_9BACT|nr:metalloregulator ArsR/SmtB family transcription factor [Fimbriiglobus ruber]OWK36819.1 Transcriptional regulator, ArsR family [Fimbriiglobus ruber]
MRTTSQTRLLDSTFHALADPTRRAILQRLTQSDARVTDLAAPFRISLNSVSKHIRILERAKLVERRRVGREHILRFRAEPLQVVQDWIRKQQDFWRAGLEALDGLLNQADTPEK